ncbi:kinesin-like protein KIN-14J [Salvia splendens]|uniref:kinesin-like protein KIN-14J n=1 Tax=Salvia splendens TaxID=180675 RepID=UPI001C279CED|nr:kinesin-like protein KIN-14J [Salvia splendens]XP_042036073.1 kinesin-like protein KIN-14J [Salvia splendens]XP_042036074.1 kinesin-like protein KIN-14J [Salvia splendens]XP_042036075.1 kinesin-like protein KIN-14J [Salvia splendens]XP_042036076.1 kinesin-like protein KIN-14J [Salvia splendens]XP_042036077.1 kinesin-like protein KIN-14J [Salvia splendens]XP_042036078.1 kinesin-like protein KIN-14J [Salvia splendens]
MDPKSEIHATEHREGALSEVRNGNISGRVEVSNGLAEGNGHFWEAFKIPEMKLGNLEKVSTHSLFTIVEKILDDRIEKNDEDIPQRVASVLKLVVQEIEQRVLKQADNMRKQSHLYKSREDRYCSKIKVLETLATGTSEENEVIVTQLQQMKIEKAKIEENKKREEQELIKLRKERDACERQILSLYEKVTLAQISYEENILQLKSKAEESKDKLEKKILNIESLLTDSRKKVKELEDSSESKLMHWKRKEQRYRQFIDSKVVSIQDLRLASESIKQEVSKIKNVYAEEFYNFGLNLKGLVEAAENYHSVLDENRKLYNEVQDLKGNIRVYCRVRPFLSGQSAKQTTMQYLGENGELVVMNPSKPGKESHRLFKFNKVFGPASTQEEVFRDTQPLIRSVLDGYNVCIFAYGQTGSGKTYTMTGPNLTSVADWGVNYRALNDLFNISQRRHSSIAYEIAVQMVEIYNEQVRDLLRNDSFQKRLGIWNISQPNGLAVPDASLHPVKSTDDVLELMSVGLMNRAVGATALNERSSRSHSILTVHVRGTDLETNAILRGCLHLVDLAGSERVDRSEATGDRLREAQHINKSLSALGDVIFALAQKNAHVPYRNSKLTQVLQSSLGGQAKTLMFVQLNPDVESYSETISTLKFAERVSGVELGAARSNKESRGVRELMEQVTSLKNAVSKKDEEIGRLRSLKASGDGERGSLNSARCGSASPRRHSAGARPSPKVSQGKSSSEKVATDEENNSEYSDKHSEAGSQQSADEFKHHKEFFRQSRLSVLDADRFPDDTSLNIDVVDGEKNPNDDIEILGLGEDDSEERLSDISDGVLSMGTETEGSINSIVEYTLFPEKSKLFRETTDKPRVPGKHPKPPTKQAQAGSARLSQSKSSSKIPSYRRATTAATGGSSSAMKPSKKWH